ncbi:MAG TPA: Sec-independent protein translocase protein TatB [Pyrinomonadaceae bacterium]|nr:Sec-independent protein translocase protein TatB [Pyrinomonadaceae bacterium]
MFLLIFESIGTSELILIGIVALIFLGPRRLPEIARKMGKIMADLRSTTAEFKETWEREVNFEEEAKALKELVSDVESSTNELDDGEEKAASAPEIKQIDSSKFSDLTIDEGTEAKVSTAEPSSDGPETSQLSDKRNWL